MRIRTTHQVAETRSPPKGKASSYCSVTFQEEGAWAPSLRAKQPFVKFNVTLTKGIIGLICAGDRLGFMRSIGFESRKQSYRLAQR